jgi:MarR family transcriptional regulator, organic hydroperoxide resistance regulator
VSDFLSSFTRAAKLMRSVADAELSRHGVRVGQNLVLAELWRSDGLTPGEVASRMHLTTPTVVKMASRMAAAGLLTRRRDDRDGRLVRLYLTERGHQLNAVIERQQTELAERATAGLSVRERRCLLKGLETIVANLRDVASEMPDADLPEAL